MDPPEANRSASSSRRRRCCGRWSRRLQGSLLARQVIPVPNPPGPGLRLPRLLRHRSNRPTWIGRPWRRRRRSQTCSRTRRRSGRPPPGVLTSAHVTPPSVEIMALRGAHQRRTWWSLGTRSWPWPVRQWEQRRRRSLRLRQSSARSAPHSTASIPRQRSFAPSCT